MDENDISTMFYIGGNGSMSTVAAMTAWAAERNLDKRFIGIPKTVDNDLGLMDHCPGFASAAKVACAITHATRLDYDAYTRPEVFVLEVMGRDAGWLAASTCLTGDVDLLVLPEVDFRRSIFLEQVRAKMEQQGSCYVVVSEGARWYDGTYLSANGKAADGLGHAMLGGAAGRLKSMIVEAGIVPRGVVQDLSRVARSSNFAMSLVDLEESYDLGVSAHMRSAKPEFTGQVVGIRRGQGVDGGYNTESSSPARLRPGQLRAPLPQRVDLAELPGRLRRGARLLPPAHPRRAEADLRERHPRDHAPLQQALASRAAGHRGEVVANAKAKRLRPRRRRARGFGL